MCKESGIVVALSHVKAHSTDKYNNLVDKSCHTGLKKYLNGNNPVKKQKRSHQESGYKYYHIKRDGSATARRRSRWRFFISCSRSMLRRKRAGTLPTCLVPLCIPFNKPASPSANVS